MLLRRAHIGILACQRRLCPVLVQTGITGDLVREASQTEKLFWHSVPRAI